MTSVPVIAPPADLGLRPRHPLPGGHRNSVWLCDSPAGLIVAKTTRRSAAQLDWLLPVHSAARRAGFDLPALIPGPDGQVLRHGWTLEPFVAGTPPDARAMQALAPQIRAFHAGCPRMPQRPGFCALPDLLAGSGAPLPAEVLALLRPAWAPFASSQPQPIHGDLGPGNVILGPRGPCLIDWDEARLDLPFLDLVHSGPLTAAQARAHLALEIATCWHPEPDHAQALLLRLTGMA